MPNAKPSRNAWKKKTEITSRTWRQELEVSEGISGRSDMTDFTEAGVPASISVGVGVAGA